MKLLVAATIPAALIGCSVAYLEGNGPKETVVIPRTSVDPQSCATSFIHHSADAPEDFGRGLVSTRSGHVGYHSDSDHWGAERISFTDCSSGSWVTLTISARDGSATEIMNNETELAELLDRGSDLAGPDFVTFLQTEAESNEMENFAGKATNESCGCRAFYPYAVGDKAPYEVQQ